MSHMKKVGELLVQFLKFGCFTFGGGWSIVAQIQRVYVEEKQELTAEDLLDLTTVARSVPGVMIGNIAVLFGYRQAGFLGSLACLFGLALPPLAVLAVITGFYTAFRDNYWVAAAMSGVRAAVVPILLSAALPMIRAVCKKPAWLPLTAIAAVLYLVFDVGVLWLVALGAVCGLVFTIRKKGRGETR